MNTRILECLEWILSAKILTSRSSLGTLEIYPFTPLTIFKASSAASKAYHYVYS